MSGHDLHPERAEHERKHVRGAGEPVVDDDAEAAVAHGVGVDRREQLGRVRLAHPRGIRDASDLAGRDATELAAREMLLDLLLHRGAHLDSGRLEELDPDHLGVVRADPDVEARRCAPRDFTRCRATAAGLTRRSATWTPVDESPEIIARLIIRQAAAPSRLATTRAPRFERGAERGGEPHCDIRRQVDVHHPRHPGLPKTRVVPRDSQIRLSCSVEPVSTSLNG